MVERARRANPRARRWGGAAASIREQSRALDAALRKALNGHFPNLRGVHLVDYKVRVINSEAGTAAAVRVVIESQDADGATWGTVGVNENVIKASWDALVDSIEYKLCKDERA